MSQNYAHYTERNGRWVERPNFFEILILVAEALIIGTIVLLLASNGARGGAAPLGDDAGSRAATSSVRLPWITDGAHCRKIEPGHFDCSDPGIREKAKAVTRWYTGRSFSVMADATAYTTKESCHNPSRGSCLTAAGRKPTQGITITCPRSIPLGSPVMVAGTKRAGQYVCEDRTAEWVQDKFGWTFDIYFDDYDEAIAFGRQRTQITVFELSNKKFN